MSNLRNKIIIESNHVKPIAELRNHTSRVDVLEELLILLDDQRVQVFLKCLEPGVDYIREAPSREKVLLKQNSGKRGGGVENSFRMRQFQCEHKGVLRH